LKKVISQSSSKVKKIEKQTANNQQAVSKLLTKYQETISGLQSKLLSAQQVIQQKEDYIYQLGQQLSSSTSKLSTTVSASIAHQQKQFHDDLNNKDKVLMRLINLHSSKAKFHDFSSLRNDSIPMQQKRCIKFVEGMLMNNNGLFDGVLKEVVINSVTKYYKDNVFDCFSLLKKMDMANHVLSLSGIELLRSMVPIGKGSHYNLFPSSSAIQLVSAIVSKRGRLEVPYVLDNLPASLGGGERVVWDAPKALKLVVDATVGLSDIAKTQHVEFSVGMDGTRLYPGATLCVGGLKNNSPLGHTPISKIPNTKVNNDGNVDTLTQSCENQIVTQICIATETKLLMQSEFVDQLQLYKAETLAATKSEQSTILGLIFLAFIIAVEGDLSGHWKCNGVGGATKVHSHPCHCCLITTNTLVSYSTDYANCKWCSELIRIGWITQDQVQAKSFKCTHRDMLTTKLLPKLKQDLTQARSSLPTNYQPVTATDSVPVLQSPLDFNSPTSIDLASAVNRIQATVPLTGQAFWVIFLRGHISLKNRT
jgi:hypothetical protein